MSAPLDNHKALMQFHSKLENDLLLVEVLSVGQHFVVRVLGEDDAVFGASADAIAYAKLKNSTFY